jgi:hypothetical protein
MEIVWKCRDEGVMELQLQTVDFCGTYPDFVGKPKQRVDINGYSS